MFLKKIWNKLGVSNKLFFTSITLVILSTIVVYSALYALFPKAYLFYKGETVSTGVNHIISNCKDESTLTNMFIDLNQFSYDNNVDILVKNDGGIIYISSRFLERFSSDMFTKSEQSKIEKRFNSQGIVKKISFYSKAQKQHMTLEVRIPTQPISQITRVMLVFMPIVIAITIVISIVSSYLYSKAVTKPLLKINDIAKSMAKLDFSKKLKIDSDDELSQLAVSLNEMSSSLEKSITELEESNKKLLSDIEKEKIAEKKRREFIGTISHELKSPITIVSGQLEGMIYNIGAFKDRDKYLQKSYDVMQDMRELVGEILELNKYESEAFKIEMEKINLSTMVNESIEKKAFYIREKNIEMLTNIDDNIFVYADMKLIKKVLDNIIGNAIKYSEYYTCINIDLFKGEKVELEVSNTGEDISKEDLEKMFTPFYRLEKSRNRKTGGSGLGLYIVKNILDKHTNMNYNMSSKDGNIKFSLEVEI
ncbi:HAMP domain-containing sensor histidine kinase [uncultured Clostridium sp.]|jgi:two-component system sensor histidine kinase VanS|uniref:sensor histidine kinase n=1 Tax=uncultured Clostridium sp. TaxID=59620 RepID=UPI00260EE550|nr:HAMP domain-containing sensor histidine kinase [uncultured Clostridium sp.]